MHSMNENIRRKVITGVLGVGITMGIYGAFALNTNSQDYTPKDSTYSSTDEGKVSALADTAKSASDITRIGQSIDNYIIETTTGISEYMSQANTKEDANHTASAEAESNVFNVLDEKGDNLSKVTMHLISSKGIKMSESTTVELSSKETNNEDSKKNESVSNNDAKSTAGNTASNTAANKTTTNNTTQAIQNTTNTTTSQTETTTTVSSNSTVEEITQTEATTTANDVEPTSESTTSEPATEPETEPVSESGPSAYNVTEEEYMLLCNVVGHEYGADWVAIEEKAKVVEVVMNRVNSPLFPNNIFDVVTQRYQFTGASGYAYLGTYSYQVTDSVKASVDYYFEHTNEFQHGYLSFWGDGWQNHFS